jgi:ABC-type lipoprotein release transport system permease subunit
MEPALDLRPAVRVHNGDRAVLALVAIVLLTVGVLAALFPACRAAKVDPLEALRYE